MLNIGWIPVLKSSNAAAKLVLTKSLKIKYNKNINNLLHNANLNAKEVILESFSTDFKDIYKIQKK